MFCQNCGKEIKDTEKFCPNCGEPVVSEKNEAIGEKPNADTADGEKEYKIQSQDSE